MMFGRMELTPSQQKTLMDLAQGAIRSTLSRRPLPDLPGNTDPVLLTPAGCFVSLHEHASHRLRGCIGRLQSSEPLLKTVRDTAVGALGDPRFTSVPVRADELPRLEIELSILSPMESAANTLDFDREKHGIYLVFGSRTGVFLPQVARETGWTKEQLLDRLCEEKLGMDRLIWRNPHAKLYRFTATIIGPEPFAGVGQ
jgi:AmmeMemoRadiSam system protein A